MYRSKIFKVVYSDGFSLWISATGPRNKELFRYHQTWEGAMEYVSSGAAAKDGRRIDLGLF